MTRPVYEDEEDLNRERELTLGTGVILGIFLALVVLCGAFFGFGYKMGSRQPMPLSTSTGTDSGTQPSSSMFSGFKPAAGSPMGSSAGSGSQPAAQRPGSGQPPRGASGAESAQPVAAPAVHAAAPVVTTPEAPAATGNFVVQVAAVSHEEDAQLLVSALRAKGYPVSAHADTGDKFFHIQVGPYTNMKDATAAKQKLVADGYQPIIK